MVSQSTKKDQSFHDPSAMSVEELEQEINQVMSHREKIARLPDCNREVCNGKPHAGTPYPHEAKYRIEPTPLDMATRLDAGYQVRPHLQYLSDQLTGAVESQDGQGRMLTVSMPPRTGKSQMVSTYFPIWLLHRHPEWKIGLISHSPSLAGNWGRQVRREIEEHSESLNVRIAADAGAVSNWETTEGGGVVSRSAPGQTVTGLGFNVLIIDDPVKDYADAHSFASREALWDWWVANALTRLEPPGIVIVVGTRWHEDDFIGRLLSKEYTGNPADWKVISFPALAEGSDVLGREPGQPLYSPLTDETEYEAIARWAGIKEAVGTYSWSALYQQRPAPAEGAIFDIGWWKYWTTDADRASNDGRTIYVDPETLNNGRWMDSWDMTFKGTESSDYVVGQRWVRHRNRRLLIHQWRGRWTFTQTLAKMRESSLKDNHVVSPYGHYVYERLIEDAANGAAIIDTLKEEITGLKAVPSRASKEARSRAITPEVESGNVYLPHPSDPGNEWVQDLLGELRDFPSGMHDDQVDALTQALTELRESGRGQITVPGQGTVRTGVPMTQRRIQRNYSQAATGRPLPPLVPRRS